MKVKFTLTPRVNRLRGKNVIDLGKDRTTGIHQRFSDRNCAVSIWSGISAQIAPGRFDIEIDRGDESSNMWPVGWKPEQSFSEILPVILRAIPLDVEDVSINALVGAISEKIAVPHFSSAHALKAKGLDNIETLKYTRKNDRISPARLFRLRLATRCILGLIFASMKLERCSCGSRPIPTPPHSGIVSRM